MSKETEAPSQVEEESYLWDFTFSSDFEVGDNCAKFTPCYSRRPAPEPGNTEVAPKHDVQNCFVDLNETNKEK